MHVNVLVRLKSYQIKLLKVELTHLDIVIGSWIAPACKHLNWTQTGLSVLRRIDLCDICDLELEQHKLVKESQEENKNPVSTKGSMHQNCSKSKA